mgnify:CR=1 FL=1
MMHLFKIFFALSPWIAAVSYVVQLGAQGLDTLLTHHFILGALLILLSSLAWTIALVAAPFAVVNLARKALTLLRGSDIPDAVKRVEWQANAAKGLSGATRAFTRASRGGVQITKTAGRGIGKGVTLAVAATRKVNWAAGGKTTARGVAGLTIILMQFAVVMGGLTSAAAEITILRTHPALGPEGVAAILGALLWPFLIIGLAALQTRFNLIRSSDYSLDALRSFGTRMFKFSPFVAVAVIIASGLALGAENWGWMILIAPFLLVQIVVYGAVLCGVILAFRALMIRFHKTPMDPPDRTEPPEMMPPLAQ